MHRFTKLLAWLLTAAMIPGGIPINAYAAQYAENTAAEGIGTTAEDAEPDAAEEAGTGSDGGSSEAEDSAEESDPAEDSEKTGSGDEADDAEPAEDTEETDPEADVEDTGTEEVLEPTEDADLTAVTEDDLTEEDASDSEAEYGTGLIDVEEEEMPLTGIEDGDTITETTTVTVYDESSILPAQDSLYTAAKTSGSGQTDSELTASESGDDGSGSTASGLQATQAAGASAQSVSSSFGSADVLSADDAESTDTGAEALTATSETSTTISIPAYYASDKKGNIVLPDYLKNLSLKDQNPYNTCWAFTSMAMAEISMLKNGKIDSSQADFSELALAYFCYNTQTDPLGGTEGDSNYIVRQTSSGKTYDFLSMGGHMMFSQNILAGWTGATDESKAEYSDASAALENGLDGSIAYDDAGHLTDYCTINMSETDAVKEAILENGSVGIPIWFSSAYYVSDTNCYYTGRTTSGANHAVTIVGWNDNIPKENFANKYGTPADDGGWLIRNSWYDGGDTESMEGYCWVSYDEKTIGSTVYSFAFDDASDYDNNYQYDGGMYNTSTVSATTLYAANVFTAHGAEDDGGDMDERLDAVSFCTGNTKLDYTVYIYTGLTADDDPTSGTLVVEQTGSEVYAGYHTVKLDTPVRITEGDKFSVVFKFKDGDGDSVYLKGEKNGDITVSDTAYWHSDTSAQAGQSLYRSSGTWIDYGEKHGANFRIKAFTVNIPKGITDTPEITAYENGTGVSLNVTEYPETGSMIYTADGPVSTDTAIYFDRGTSASDVYYVLDSDLTDEESSTYSLNPDDAQEYSGTPVSLDPEDIWGDDLPNSTLDASTGLYIFDKKIRLTVMAVKTGLYDSPLAVIDLQLIDSRNDLGDDLAANPEDAAYLAKELGKSVSELKASDIPDGVWTAGLSEDGYAYTGKAVTIPGLHVYCGRDLLTAGKDYSLTYYRNTAAYTLKKGEDGFLASKAPTVKITGKGNYSDVYYLDTDKTQLTFTINPVSLGTITDESSGDAVITNSTVLTAADIYVNASNKVQKSAPAVKCVLKKDDGTVVSTATLSKGRDYTLQYEGIDFPLSAENQAKEDAAEADPEADAFVPFKTPGSYVIRIVGKGNYTGTAYCTEYIRGNTVKLMSRLSYTVGNSKYAYSEEDAALDASGKWYGIAPSKITVKNGSAVLKGFFAEGVGSAAEARAMYEAACEAAGEGSEEEGSDPGNCGYIYYCTDNRGIGTAHIVFVGVEANGFSGVLTKNYKITGTALSAAVMDYARYSDSVQKTNYTYTGQPIEAAVNSVTYKASKNSDAVTLTGMEASEYAALAGSTSAADLAEAQAVDYTYSYLNNVNAGTASIVFCGRNGYTGTVKKTYRIDAADVTKLLTESEDAPYIKLTDNDTSPATDWTDADTVCSAVYTKGAVKPAAGVSFMPAPDSEGSRSDSDLTVLTAGTDYKVSYGNNSKVNDGTGKSRPYVKLVFKGNFKGTLTRYFTITAKDLGTAGITAAAADVTYRSQRTNICSPAITVTDTNGNKLMAGTDYVKPTVKAGSYVYAEDATVRRYINKQWISVKVFTGTTVSTADEIPAGAVISVTICAKETSSCNYTGQTEAKFRFAPAQISGVKASIKNQAYTGRAVEPRTTLPADSDDAQITVYVWNGRTKVLLTPGTDYEIVPGSYKNNINRGKASLVIRGLGNYGGTKTVYFTIGRRTFLFW